VVSADWEEKEVTNSDMTMDDIAAKGIGTLNFLSRLWQMFRAICL